LCGHRGYNKLHFLFFNLFLRNYDLIYYIVGKLLELFYSYQYAAIYTFTHLSIVMFLYFAKNVVVARSGRRVYTRNNRVGIVLYYINENNFPKQNRVVVVESTFKKTSIRRVWLHKLYQYR